MSEKRPWNKFKNQNIAHQNGPQIVLSFNDQATKHKPILKHSLTLNPEIFIWGKVN